MSKIFYGGKKVLLITGTTNILGNEKAEELFDLTLPSKERYAKKHGYDLLAMRSFGDGNPYGFRDTHVGFLRAVVAFEMLFTYETVFWIDADSLITNHDYDLKTFGINSQKTLYASYDWEWKNSFSAGNFILHRTSQWKDLFQLFLKLGTQNFIEDSAQEQTTLNVIHKHTSMSETFQILDHKYLGAIPKILENTETWIESKRPKINWPWDESCFLAHFGGLTNNKRIELIKNNFHEYI